MAARAISVFAISTASPTGYTKQGSSSFLSFPRNFKSDCSLFGQNLLIQSSNLCSVLPKKQTCSAVTVLYSLPTAKPDREMVENAPKWSARGIKSFAMSELEARKLKYPKTGTEALLMGILVEGTSNAAKFLRANGITLFKVRDETIALLGKSDMYYFSPEHPPLTEQAQRALDWAVDEKLKS
ncbi:hypothetical protein MKW94_012882, partial [Papaver nudicaule]|nr:hypothetical protein [Papaver nudicaule]